ncbi:MAG: S41 family peptidase [Bacteroides sp.]|nr:S41 family peptidase [Bacteroides sp.]
MRRKKSYALPVEVSFVENQAVVTDIDSLNTILRKGDILLSIDGETINDIIENKKMFISASNHDAFLRVISTELVQTNKEQLQVKYDRGGKEFSDFVTCLPISKVNLYSRISKAKPLLRYVGDSILCVYLGSTIGGSIPDKIEANGIIIDLRCYPNGKKVKGYWDFEQLYPTTQPFAAITTGSIENHGLFHFKRVNYAGVMHENPSYYKGVKVLIVNEITQSQAEYMAMKYKCSPNTYIIGSTTAGADGDITFLPLPGGLRTSLTGLGIYYPDGTEAQRIGILPDIWIKPTIKGIRQGRDELLEKAVEIINSKREI